jgi:hypothetical protein
MSTVLVPLTQGKFALIDEADAERVLSHKWRASLSNGKWYAKGWTAGREELLHRFILDAPKGTEVDHRNGDGLDCQRDNLRLATRTQNNMNKPHRRDSSSGYKGVRFIRGQHSTTPRPWRAEISARGNRYWLGRFSTALAAAQAYDMAAKQLHGEFAKVNFPEI